MSRRRSNYPTRIRIFFLPRATLDRTSRRERTAVLGLDERATSRFLASRFRRDARSTARIAIRSRHSRFRAIKSHEKTARIVSRKERVARTDRGTPRDDYASQTIPRRFQKRSTEARLGRPLAESASYKAARRGVRAPRGRANGSLRLA